MAGPAVDVWVFWPVIGLIVAFLFLGFRIRLFGCVGGFFMGLLFAWLTASGATVTEFVGSSGVQTSVLSFAPTGASAFAYGIFGLFFAALGFSLAILYAKY